MRWGSGWRDVRGTSRAVQSGIRRPWRCRLSVAGWGTALRAGGRLCTWTHPRPLSAPFPPTAPTSGAYPLTPDCPPCGAAAPQANRGILCRGIGGQGAWQPSLRSGRLRRSARAERDSSRRRTPCPQCLVLVRRADGSLLVVNAYSVCVQLLGWTHPHPLRSRHFPLLMEGGDGQSGFFPAAFQSSVSSPYGCSGLRTISAPVGAFLLAALVTAPDRPPPGTSRHR